MGEQFPEHLFISNLLLFIKPVLLLLFVFSQMIKSIWNTIHTNVLLGIRYLVVITTNFHIYFSTNNKIRWTEWTDIEDRICLENEIVWTSMSKIIYTEESMLADVAIFWGRILRKTSTPYFISLQSKITIRFWI